MRLYKTAVAAAALPVGFAAAQQSAPARHAFTPADWYKVTQVSTPALSPDGSKIAITVTTVRETENRRHSEVWVVPTQGGEPTRYTSPGYESSNPRFSDDGKILYFTSQRPGGRGANWALHMDQPAGEAYQPDRAPTFQTGSQPSDKSFTITAGEGGGFGGRGGGRGGFPGGQQQDSVTANPNDPYAKMAPISRPPYDAVTKPENASRFDGRQITQMGYKANGQGQFIPGPSTAPRPPQQPVPAQIFIERAGSAKKAITNTKYSHREAIVSPDGKWIAFVADAKLRPDSVVSAERDSISKLPPDRKRDEMPINATEIFVVSTAACEANSACEPRKIEYAGNESQLSWSPDSKQIAFVGQPGRFKNQRLFVVSVDGGKPQDILGTWQYEPGQIQWLKNGSIMMQTSTGGSRGVYAIDPASKKVSTIIGGRRVVSSATLDASQSHVVYISTDQTHPTELFIANADGSNEKAHVVQRQGERRSRVG